MFKQICIFIAIVYCLVKICHYIQERKNKIKKTIGKISGDRGAAGEKAVRKFLKALPQEKYHVFNNILLETNFGTTQIDHLVISQYGIFVIETKNYKGVISAKNNSQDWYQCINSQKEMPISNPVIQNFRHINHLMRSFGIKDRSLFKSIVTFSRSANVIAQSDYSDICYYDALVNNIEKYYVKILSADDVRKCCDYVEQNNIMSTKNMKKHTEYAKSLKRENS